MSPFLRRVLLLVVFLLAIVAGGAQLSQAQPAKPAAPDLQPRKIPDQSRSQIDPPPAENLPLPDTTGENASEKGAPDANAPRSPGALILNEGFEGAWPAGLWTVVDQSSTDGGEYLWNDRSCSAHTGSWHGFSTGGGANGGSLPCEGPYPNGVDTWAEYGPFDLSAATAATLTYSFKGVTEGDPECDYDRFFVGHSVNGSSYVGPTYCGGWIDGPDGNGYFTDTIDLSSRLGDAAVWVAFALTADSSVTFQGMLIDDVRLDVVTGSCATPAAPALSSPAAGASLTDTTPTFSWAGVANANAYEIEVDNNADFSSPVIDQTLGATSYTPGAALALGTYYWRVGANNTAGGCSTFGPWSITRSFAITSGGTCYQLTLDKTGQGGNPTASPSASSGCAAGRYTAGQTINLTASPAGGWRVDSWQGTNNNGSTANSNTATMPAAAHSVRVNYVQQSSASRAVMPFILYGLSGFLGPREIEPNSTIAEANGPILLNRNYQGFPNDLSDYYYFDLNTTRQLSISLTGITGHDPQLHLYRDSSANRVGYDSDAPYSISYNAPPGRYWVRVVVVGNYNSTSLYTLRVSAP